MSQVRDKAAWVAFRQQVGEAAGLAELLAHRSLAKLGGRSIIVHYHPSS